MSAEARILAAVADTDTVENRLRLNHAAQERNFTAWERGWIEEDQYRHNARFLERQEQRIRESNPNHDCDPGDCTDATD